MFLTKKRLIQARTAVVMLGVMAKSFPLKMVLLTLIPVVIYLEYRVSTAEEQEEMRKGIAGRTNIILYALLLVAVYMMHFMFEH
jgi:hypothetical protein